MEELIIGAWGDGTECVGGSANSNFQSSGGNCFLDVIFDLDCSDHGPFSEPEESTAASGAVTLSCVCPRGWDKLSVGGSTVRWQCNQPDAAPAPTASVTPGWVMPFAAICAAATLISGGFAWWVRRSYQFWATNGGAGHGDGMRDTLVDWAAVPSGAE